MSTMDEIKAQVEKLSGLDRFLARRTLKELPHILHDDETIEDILPGRYDLGDGFLVATSRRLLFVKSTVFGVKVEDFPLSGVSSIHYETGIMWGKILITSSGMQIEIEQVDNTGVKDFAKIVGNRIAATKPS